MHRRLRTYMLPVSLIRQLQLLVLNDFFGIFPLHIMPGFPVFHRIKQNGKVIILRIQLGGRHMEFYPFVVNPYFFMGHLHS